MRRLRSTHAGADQAAGRRACDRADRAAGNEITERAARGRAMPALRCVCVIAHAPSWDRAATITAVRTRKVVCFIMIVGFLSPANNTNGGVESVKPS
jgi:hypothetical protein